VINRIRASLTEGQPARSHARTIPHAIPRSPARMLRGVLRNMLPFAIGAACLWLLADRLGALDLHEMMRATRAITTLQWLGAALATAVSLWAVGRYDAIVHAHLGTGIAGRDATHAGVVSIALAQTVGMGLLSGTLARWRMLPDLGLARAAQITTYVSVSFMAGLAVIIAAAGLVLPMPPMIPAALLVLVLLGAAGLTVLAFVRPAMKIGRFTLSMPSLPAMGAILALTLLDTVAAAAALYLLLPGEIALGFAQLLPVFLLALGAGLLSGAPGGIGAFELTLIALLPHLPEPQLLGAILAFRVIYYALPACLAFVSLAKPLATRRVSNPVMPAGTARGETLLGRASRSELGVLRQNGGQVMETDAGALGYVTTSQSLTALFDPLDLRSPALLHRFTRLARQSGRVACFYKLSSRHAVTARKAGLKLLHIADEAVIDAGGFTLDGAHHRQLRRKLRHAEKSGLVIARADNRLPLCDMAQVDRAWKSGHGPARGTSMGQFAPEYLTQQWVFLARFNGQLVGFVTFHVTESELCLDLMRARPDLPDGTMQALIVAAITAAKTTGIDRLSLAALPATGTPNRPRECALRDWLNRTWGAGGLRQFKLAFAPRLEPLYLAAPTWGAMALAGADLARAIRWPDAPRSAPLPDGANQPAAHDQDEEYEFAPAR